MPTEELREAAAKYLMQTYTRQPISIVRGKGSKVYDLEGREYLDFVGGIAVNVLGHGHPDLVQAIQRQAAQLIHTSNLYYTEPQVQLAKTLVELSFADRVFFCNSGAEANEAAIKLARRYAHNKYGADRHGPDRHTLRVSAVGRDARYYDAGQRVGRRCSHRCLLGERIGGIGLCTWSARVNLRRQSAGLCRSAGGLPSAARRIGVGS